jgi:hypothetical protein
MSLATILKEFEKMEAMFVQQQQAPFRFWHGPHKGFLFLKK